MKKLLNKKVYIKNIATTIPINLGDLLITDDHDLVDYLIRMSRKNKRYLTYE